MPSSLIIFLRMQITACLGSFLRPMCKPSQGGQRAFLTAVLWHVQSYPGRHGMGPAHPEHEVGVALHSLQVGQTVQVKGPFGSFRYQPGKYKAIGERCEYSPCTALHIMPLPAHLMSPASTRPSVSDAVVSTPSEEAASRKAILNRRMRSLFRSKKLSMKQKLRAHTTHSPCKALHVTPLSARFMSLHKHIYDARQRTLAYAIRLCFCERQHTLVG